MRWETDMRLMKHRAHARVAAISAFIIAQALTFSAARAEDKTYVMKLGTATINDSQHEWCKRFVAMVEKDSGGRIKGEIYPASQLGPIPRQIEGVQFGAIQGYVGPPEFLVGVDRRYEVLSAPGLVDGMEHGIRVSADPEVQKMMYGLGEAKGIHGVALWVSQPSSIIARARRHGCLWPRPGRTSFFALQDRRSHECRAPCRRPGPEPTALRSGGRRRPGIPAGRHSPGSHRTGRLRFRAVSAQAGSPGRSRL